MLQAGVSEAPEPDGRPLHSFLAAESAEVVTAVAVATDARDCALFLRALLGFSH